jgi:hypothetical protein
MTLKLPKQLSPWASDDGITSKLKKYLHENQSIAVQHCTATLLDPGLNNNFNIIPFADHATAANSLRQPVDNVPYAEPTLPADLKGQRLRGQRKRKTSLTTSMPVHLHLFKFGLYFILSF